VEIMGRIFSSIAYNNPKDGIAIKINIRAGVKVQTTSNTVL